MTSVESPASSPTIDPVTFEVIWHRLEDITEEMGIKYMRTSGSPVLVGSYDASTGITLPNGELVVMGPYITTQAHVLNLIVNSVISERAGTMSMRAGDMFICNDPYLGATHQPDVATVAPVVHGGRVEAWVGSSGHWLDIGGSEPGGFNMTARSVFDEGLRLPPTRIVEEGLIREDLIDLIMAQLREPLAELDLRGQIVANKFGSARLTELFDAFGIETVSAVMHGGISHVEQMLRARLRELPDGIWREVQYLDHDGHEPNVRQIVCTVTKRGDKLTVDFTGSAPQVAGFANCAPGGLRAATLSAVCVMLGYDLTWNDGVSRCVDIVAPPRTIVTAEFPTPVSMSTISAIIVTLNLVFATLSRMLLSSPSHREEAMANWCGTSLGVSMLGHNERGQLTVAPESSHFAAGCGARSYEDGVDTGGIIINTTANIPSIEATEAEYPLLYLCRAQVVDSGGAGRFRGGMSAGVALIPYADSGDLETSFAGVGAETPNALGLAGGLPGAAVKYVRHLGADVPGLIAQGRRLPTDPLEFPGERRIAPLNESHREFPADSIEYHNWQGGGGYGDPITRDPKRVAEDVRELRVSRDAAFEQYGVVLSEEGAVDGEATKIRRDEIRADRLEVGRPYAEVLGSAMSSDWSEQTSWVDEQTYVGMLTFGDGWVMDFERGRSICRTCHADLGPANDDARMGSLVDLSSTEKAGPGRGEDYDHQSVVLARFYCPGCGHQLDAALLYRDLSRHGGYLPAARVAGITARDSA